MSGLLSKANAAEGTVENEVKAETVAEVAPAVHEGGGPDVPTILKTGGWTVIIIGGLLFGVIGMITAVPSYTALKVIMKEFLSENKIVKELTKNI